MKRNLFLAAALAAGSLMGIASTAQAVPAVVAGTGYGPNVIIQTAPPAPIYEAVPAARPGYIWAPGYYSWNGDRYVWNGGHWMETRQGYAYAEPRWVQRADGSWYLTGGEWVRSDRYSYYNDRDRRDWAHERGPWGDRDHDGVVNRYDDYPRDPSRS